MSEEAIDIFEDEVAQEEQEAQDDAIQIAFNEAISEDADEDDIKLAMIQAGATFKNVTRLYNQYMIDAGLAISKQDRDQIVTDTLEGLNFESEEEFDDAVARLEEGIKGCNTRSAANLVRAYAKKNDMECYKKPAGDSGTRNPFVRRFHDALIENPQMTKEQLQEIIDGLDEHHRTNPQRWFNQHDNIRKTANAIAAKFMQ